MANINAMILSQVKKKLATAQAEVERWEAVAAAFDGPIPRPPRRGRKANGTTVVKTKGRGNRNPQAAQDALAVKRGTATPEQMKRYAERMAAKTPAAASLAAASD